MVNERPRLPCASLWTNTTEDSNPVGHISYCHCVLPQQLNEATQKVDVLLVRGLLHNRRQPDLLTRQTLRQPRQ